VLMLVEAVLAFVRMQPPPSRQLEPVGQPA